MTIFRQPEIPLRFGGLDDEAFTDGAVVGAGEVREILRNNNDLVRRGHLVDRWVTRANPPTGVEDGYGLAIAAPFWQLALPVLPTGLPVEKKWGLSRLRMRVRADIEADRVVELFLATSVNPDPSQAAAPTLTCRGIGGTDVYTVADIPCRRGAGEELALFMRARIDIDNDPLLDTGTYGGVSSGTIDSAPTLYSMRSSGAAWNTTGDQVHTGGHYLVTRDAAGAARVQGAEIRAVGPDSGGGVTDELVFWPPASDQRHLVGADFEIRKLPLVRFVSVAIYAQDRAAP